MRSTRASRRVCDLSELYSEVHRYAAGHDRGDTPLVRRKLVPRSLDGDLILLAQGLAQSTQRVTGYPYRRPEGLSQAGRRLDDFLKPLGYTIDHTDETRTYAYSTDLVPWYPGRDPRGKGDLKPSPEEVEHCWRWFEAEVALVEPQAMLLLGLWPADRFLRRYERQRFKGPLSEAATRLYEVEVLGRRIATAIAYHPSAAWGRFEVDARHTWRSAAELLAPVLRVG